MSDLEVVDDVIAEGPRPNTTGGRRSAGVISESIHVGSHVAVRDTASDGEDETVGEGGRTAKPFKESTQKLLAKLEVPDEGDDDEADPDDAGLLEAADALAKVATPAEVAAVAAAVDDKPDPTEEIRADRDRLVEHNRRLVAELEARPKTAAKAELSARDKALDEAEKVYLDDSIGAVRMLIATVLGVPLDSKEVDAELSGLHTDLTSRELNVPLEQSYKATREAGRARQMLARDKRERKAESEAAKVPVVDEAKDSNEAVSFVESRISKHVESYPLLTAFAEELDGLKPSELICRIIQRDTKSGAIDATKMTDDQLIEAASKTIEAHYKKIADKFGNLKPLSTTDTTKTETTAPLTTSKDPRTVQARTITNASASVAPATSPAKKPVATATDEKPKFKSAKERLEWALRHIPVPA